LPYVNLAILLALAGEDYSGVVEVQKPGRQEIKGEAFRTYLMNLKKHHGKIKPDWTTKNEPFLPKGEWVIQEKSIFYDTDWFKEHRKDYIRRCNHWRRDGPYLISKLTDFREGSPGQNTV
jgi:hypothetical protein